MEGGKHSRSEQFERCIQTGFVSSCWSIWHTFCWMQTHWHHRTQSAWCWSSVMFSRRIMSHKQTELKIKNLKLSDMHAGNVQVFVIKTQKCLFPMFFWPYWTLKLWRDNVLQWKEECVYSMLLKDSSPAAIIKKHTGCEGDFYVWKGMFLLLSGVEHTVFLRVAFFVQCSNWEGFEGKSFQFVVEANNPPSHFSVLNSINWLFKFVRTGKQPSVAANKKHKALNS